MSALLPIYADTSFFVSLYLTDRHRAEVERWLRSRPSLWMTPLHVAEWTHAVEQHVFRKSISRSEADRLLRRFHEHRAQNLWRASIAPRIYGGRRPCPIEHSKFVRNWLTNTRRG